MGLASQPAKAGPRGGFSPIANTHLHAFLVPRYWSRRVSRSDAMRTAEPRRERFPSVGAFRRPRLAGLRRRCTRMHGRVASCAGDMGRCYACILAGHEHCFRTDMWKLELTYFLAP